VSPPIPRVSVLLPARDAEATLGACLRSLQRQTLRNWECVLVEDGSRDGTGALAQAMARRDPRIRVLPTRGLGIVGALRAGLRDCRAPLVARMDADDWMHRERLAAQCGALEAEPDLPRVRANGGELNQVWLSLIDNALDAILESGRIDVTAHQELDRVVVRVADDGPGIPPEIEPRIFDAFFTTKPPGQGIGLGLEITDKADVGISGNFYRQATDATGADAVPVEKYKANGIGAVFSYGFSAVDLGLRVYRDYDVQNGPEGTAVFLEIGWGWPRAAE